MGQGDQVVTVNVKKLKSGEAVSFETKIRGTIVKGLVVKKGESFFAYLNRCMHLPITLDLDDGKYFTHDREHLQCHMHGAMYEIETGFCVAGPCQGARLTSLELTVVGNSVKVSVPAKLAES